MLSFITFAAMFVQATLGDKLSGRIAFVSNISGNWDLWVVNPDGTGLRQLTDTPIDERCPSWSPDGREIVYSTNDGNLRIIKADGSDPKMLQLNFEDEESRIRNNNHPSWSPDGKRILFVSFDIKEDDSDIWLVNTDGTGLRRLVLQKDIQTNPSWSPEGRRIIYSSAVYGPDFRIIQDLWLIRLDSRGAKRILANDAANVQAEWSPDGTKIAFASDKTGNMEIWVMDINGKNPIQITNNKGYDADPCWSPDGRHLAFVSNRTGNMQIWIVDVDGNNLRQLTSSGECKDPAWGP